LRTKHRLDARGLLCPMPVIRTQQRMSTLRCGDELEVLCSDPGAASDIPAWCRINGHEVLAMRQDDWEVTIRIHVGHQQ
jgi:tRNA 2-thiouridine synthesizing protein A